MNNNLHEEKIADGIYITRFPSAQGISTVPKQEDLKQEKKKYVYASTAELLNILENEFEEIGNEIQQLYNSNEEMLQFDPKDYDLIQAREENLVIINKRLLRLKEIQQEFKIFCPTHPLVSFDVFGHFLQAPKASEEVDKKEEDDGSVFL